MDSLTVEQLDALAATSEAAETGEWVPNYLEPIPSIVLPLVAIARRMLVLEAVVQKIADKPEGVWSTDPLTYRNNVIEWCMDYATRALLEPEGVAGD